MFYSPPLVLDSILLDKPQSSRVSLLHKYRARWSGRGMSRAPAGGCDAGPAGCPLHGQGSGSGDAPGRARQAPALFPAWGQPPGHRAQRLEEFSLRDGGWRGAGEVLAPASSTQLAHTHMQRAGNSVTNPWTVVSALIFISPLSVWPSALKAAPHRIPLPIVLRQWFHRRRPKAAPLWL